ncbi:MAG TPA: hypothetical protein VH375_11260 [Rhodanobacteraceae bacterium]|jgi:hypothetical protein
MERYGHEDRTRKSGVVAYEIHDDAIDIEFASGDVYRYDETTPGPVDVELMKRFARAGRGLTSYISKYVRDRYAEKL